MFEELWDDNDLELTENRLRVHVLTLKREGDPYPLMRLYGPLSLALAQRGSHLAAQDALGDAEFLILEHGWRGTEKEAWAMCDRTKVMRVLGREKFARRSLQMALESAKGSEDAELHAELNSLREALGVA